MKEGLPAGLQRYYDEKHPVGALLAVPPRNPYPYDRYEAARLGLSMLLPPGAAVLELAAGQGHVYERSASLSSMVSSLVALEDSLRLQAQRTLKGKPRAEYLPVNRDALDVEPFGEFPIE